jgi:hypothetical protein
MNSTRPPGVRNPGQFDCVHDVSENLEVGREEFYQTASEKHKVQGDLVKVLYESDEIRYLVIFDTDLAGTCNENAVRRVEYDYLNVTERKEGAFHASDEIEELIHYLGHWTEKFAIEPAAIMCAPWERRDLSRFDEEEQSLAVQIRDVEAGGVNFIQHPRYSSGYIDFDMNVSRTDPEENENNLVYKFRVCVLEDETEIRAERAGSSEEIPVTIFSCRKEVGRGSWERVESPLELPVGVRETLRANVRAFVSEVQSRFPDRDVTLIGDDFGFSEVVLGDGLDESCAESAQNWRAETAAKIESLEEEYDFIETAVTEYDDGVTHVEILPDRFVKQARFSVDDEQFRSEIVAEVREKPPVIVDEEIRFYRNDQAGQHVGELVVPDSLQPLLRSYLDQLEDVLEEAIGGFEINTQTI